MSTPPLNPDSTPDLLVTGSLLLTMDQERTILEQAGVAVHGDTIVAVGPAAELVRTYPEARRLETEHGLIMPGLINTHTHAAMSCFRGLADDLPLMTWLQDYIFPAESKLTGELVYQATLLSIAEMIRSGTTSFCDMYLFAKEVGRAAAACGIRAWVGEVLYDFPSPNYGPLEAGFTYVEEMFAEFAGQPLVTVTVDPHAVYTCAPDLLTRLKQVAVDHEARYVIHLSENQEEVQQVRERCGLRPVEYLDRLGLLDERVIADHCVVLNEREIEILAARQVKVAHCPESNLKLACGIAPVVRLLAAGVTVGLGTDGSASNNDVDMFGEMSTAARVHKAAALDPTVMTADTTLSLATGNGARLLGMETLLGSLEPGRKADLIVLDLDQPHLTPLYHPASHLVYAASGADVLHSVINGRVVMENRHLTTLDEGAVLARARETGALVRTWTRQGG